MMNGMLEFFAQRAGVIAIDARHEHTLFLLQKFCRDFCDLLRRFTRAEYHLRETLAQRAVRVHLRKTKVGHRRGLERLQNPVAAHTAGAEFFQETDGFSNGHAMTMPQE